MNNQTNQLTIPTTTQLLPATESIALPPPVIGSHNTPNYIFIPVMLIMVGVGIWLYKKRRHFKKQTPTTIEILPDTTEPPVAATTPSPSVKRIKPKKKKSRRS